VTAAHSPLVSEANSKIRAELERCPGFRRHGKL